MEWDDIAFFFSMLFLPILIVTSLFFVMYAMSNRASPLAEDLTSQYAIDGVLPGHKVYRIEPRGVGETLFVVVRDSEAVSTMKPRLEKHGGNVSVAVER